MKKIIFYGFIFYASTISAQTFKSLINQTKEKAASVMPSNSSQLTNEDIVSGLKEALSVGTNNSSGLAGKLDGFYKNPKIFIPWPPEATDMKSKLVSMGFSKKIEEFETSVNRAAEEAAMNSAKVFIDAIKNMSVQDGAKILKGDEHAATDYLKKTTSLPLKEKFMPIVKDAISKVKVTSYWEPLASTYNMIPFVKKQNPNLDEYITDKAIEGLMVLIADEEAKIRKDPMARVSEILKKIFGN